MTTDKGKITSLTVNGRDVPLSGDKGQRYQIDYKDKCGQRFTLGWCDTRPEVKRMSASCILFPAVESYIVMDRKKGKEREYTK